MQKHTKTSHDQARDNAACNVAKKRIKDVDKLRLRILTTWDELDQRVIDMAVRQWHTFVRVLKRKTDTEHKLSQLLVVVAYNSIVNQIFLPNFINFCLFVQRLYNKNQEGPVIMPHCVLDTSANMYGISNQYTFKSPGDVQIPIIVQFPDITSIQPSIIIESFTSLTLVVQVSHEHMTTVNTHLTTNYQQTVNYPKKLTEKLYLAEYM